MRRLASLLVTVALLAIPLMLLARLDDCVATSCRRRMCCLVHSGAAAWPCHRDGRMPGGFCLLSDSCHGKAHWDLTTLVLPVPPAPAGRLAQPQAAFNCSSPSAAHSLPGCFPEPFEPPRS